MQIKIKQTTRLVPGGLQRVFRCPNGYGLSVIRRQVPYFGPSYGAEEGLYEACPVKFTGDGDKWQRLFSCDTDDPDPRRKMLAENDGGFQCDPVEGWLTYQGWVNILSRVACL